MSNDPHANNTNQGEDATDSNPPFDASSLSALSGLASLPQSQSQSTTPTPQQLASLTPFLSALTNASYFPNGNAFMSAMLAQQQQLQQQQQQQLQLLSQQALYPGLFNVPSPTASSVPQSQQPQSSGLGAVETSNPSPSNSTVNKSEESPFISSPTPQNTTASMGLTSQTTTSGGETTEPNEEETNPSSSIPEIPPPEWHDAHVMLGVEEDRYYLSELQCILRSEFIEAFGTSQTDVVLPVQGRNKPLVLGQVGLRCKHCKHLPSSDRASHAITYPAYISSIYNSTKQMFRQHFDHCGSIPQDLKEKVGTLKDSNANRGGRKQYWVDSAKRIGLEDTPNGVHFGRDPRDAPPPLGSLNQMNSVDEDEISYQPSEDGIGSPLKVDFSRSMEDVPEPEYYPLVLPEDKPLISDYLFLALEQMQPANLMDSDRVGCYKGRRTGFPGLACKHCVGQAGCGRYFPASEASLSQTTTSQTLVNHVRNCRRCPIEVREELEYMKRAKGNFESKNGDNKPRHGGRKVFFHRLWCRIQRIPLPKNEKIEETLHKTTHKHKSSPSSRCKKRKTSLDLDEDEELSVKKSAKVNDYDHDIDADMDDLSESPSNISPAFQGSTRLSRGDDAHWLSDACCFIRQELVEAFTASEDDVDGVTVTSAGQVGIRCYYCAQKHPMENRPKGHAYYPASVAGIQDAVSDLQRRHLQLCNEIPSHIRDTFRSLKGVGAKTDGDTAQYWFDSAKELGLCDYEGGRCEVMFFRNPHEKSPADEIDDDRKADKPTRSFLVQKEDRDSCTDHIVLLLKQFTPCRFDTSDRRGGTTKSRDRPMGFPGMMCIHCSHKRYFPIAEKKVSDTTNLMQTHITNCFSAPMEVKASLCYLQHRSLIQKAQLMGNWKITFFKRVWNRLHNQDWGDGSFVPQLNVMTSFPTKTGTNTGYVKPAIEDTKDQDEGITQVHSEDITNTGEDMVQETAPNNTDALAKMKGLIKSAALWLTEQDAAAEARIRSGRGIGMIQAVRPSGRGGRGRGGRGRGVRKGL